eukprot:g40224.t1
MSSLRFFFFLRQFALLTRHDQVPASVSGKQQKASKTWSRFKRNKKKPISSSPVRFEPLKSLKTSSFQFQDAGKQQNASQTSSRVIKETTGHENLTGHFYRPSRRMSFSNEKMEVACFAIDTLQNPCIFSIQHKMSTIDYVPLQDVENQHHVEPIKLAKRLFLGLSGLLLGVGVLLSSQENSEQADLPPFVPAEGLDAVVVQPRASAPGTLQAAAPARPVKIPPCLFSYGLLRGYDEGNEAFCDGCNHAESAWVYGAQLPALKTPKGEVAYAQPTGNPEDVLKGRLLCWPAKIFKDKLHASDKARGYKHKHPRQKVKDYDPLQRSVVHAVLRNGTTAMAYWYHREALTLPSSYSQEKKTAEQSVNEKLSPSLGDAGLQMRNELPIFELKSALVAAAQADTGGPIRIVIDAPTGSGKSTQVPQILLDNGCVGRGKEIIVLQPRRLAAQLLARRVSHERSCWVGEEVGYTVRFDDKSGQKTRIRYATEGILLRRFLTDPDLKGVDTVILDEFHERHFDADLSLARCLQSQETTRPDLKIIVMSATLQTEQLLSRLGARTTHLVSKGRSFPVSIKYNPMPQARNVGEHVAMVLGDYLRGMKEDFTGHVLVFLPGAHEIKYTTLEISRQKWSKSFLVLQLYGRLSNAQSERAVAPSSKPKIIVATNIAETSLTIDGVRVVVDSGLERRADFSLERGITSLAIQPISQASADQRCGRAGRTGPGVCLRLWSEKSHVERAAATSPEVHRMDMTEAVLLLKASGQSQLDPREPNCFPWYEPPLLTSLTYAMHRLMEMGALDEAGKHDVLPLGRQLARLPVEPRLGRVLLAAQAQAPPHHLPFFAVAAALTQGRELFFKNRQISEAQLKQADFTKPGDTSDFQPLFRAWMHAHSSQYQLAKCPGISLNTAREIGQSASQFLALLGAKDQIAALDKLGQAKGGREEREKSFLPVPTGEEIGRVLLTGMIDRLAVRSSPSTLSCAVINGRRGELDAVSTLCGTPRGRSGAGQKPKRKRGFLTDVCALEDTSAPVSRILIAGEMVEIGNKLGVEPGSMRLNLATRIEEAWLRELYPTEFKDTGKATYDAASQTVVFQKQRLFRDLELQKQPGAAPPEVAARVLAQEIIKGKLTLKAWNKNTDQFVARVNMAARASPELHLPVLDEEGRTELLARVCANASSWREVKDRPDQSVSMILAGAIVTKKKRLNLSVVQSNVGARVCANASSGAKVKDRPVGYTAQVFDFSSFFSIQIRAYRSLAYYNCHCYCSMPLELKCCAIEYWRACVRTPAASSKRKIVRISVAPAVTSWLTPQQAEAVNRLSPSSVTLSNGHNLPLTYPAGPGVNVNAPPTLRAPVQELFTPRVVFELPPVCIGRVKILVEILSPDGKQVVHRTEDLRTFWTQQGGGYEKVRAQFRDKFPKYAWPEHGDLEAHGKKS